MVRVTSESGNRDRDSVRFFILSAALNPRLSSTSPVLIPPLARPLALPLFLVHAHCGFVHRGQLPFYGAFRRIFISLDRQGIEQI